MVADQPLDDAAGKVGLELQRGEIDQLDRSGAREKSSGSFGVALSKKASGRRRAEQRLDLGVETIARLAQQAAVDPSGSEQVCDSQRLA